MSSSPSPPSSLEGSPTMPSYLDTVYHPTAPTVDRRLSEAALAKLGSLTEFLSAGHPTETPIAALMRDTELCEALREIHKKMISYLSGKGIGNRGLDLILEHCPLLQSLNISGFHMITEAALPRIATLRHLTNLNLCGTAVTDLTTLNTALPGLTSVNFYQTPITSYSLITFLQNHSIRILIPPKNPPKGFFARFPLDQLLEVKLHIDESDANTMDLNEALDFLKEAPSLQKMYLWMEVPNAHFHTHEVSVAPTQREFTFKNKTNEMTVKIKGKKS